MEKLIYTNSLGKSIELSVQSDYILKSIDGTAGVDLNIQSNKSYSQDGESYQESTLEPRFINVELVIMASSRNGMSDKRRKIISVLNPKLELGTVEYQYGKSKRTIKALPEKSPDFVTKDWGRDYIQETLITFYCPNPYWKDLKETREDVSTEVGNFEFPLGIPVEGIELSIRTINYLTNIYNAGDVETPIRVVLRAKGNVTNPIITNNDTGEFIRVKRKLAEGDTLEVNTEFGNKRVDIVREDGTKENAFNYIDYKSTFFSVCAGDTTIEYGAEIGDNNLDVYIYYTPKYLGV